MWSPPRPSGADGAPPTVRLMAAPARRPWEPTARLRPAAHRGPGRPRDEHVDEKLLQAALARLVRDGYDRLRVDDVAADAGVAKTTLYRRWRSKAALVAEVMRQLYLDRVNPVDHGALRPDLVALLHENYELLFEGSGRVMEDLVRGSGTSRELADVVRSTTQARRRAFHQAMNRAVARGELDPSVDHDLVIDLLVGPLWTRLLVSDVRMSSDEVERIVDAVIGGIGLG